jgi:hypothetical protein
MPVEMAFDPQMELLITLLAPIVESDDAGWAPAHAAFAACEEKDEELELILMEEDRGELRALWDRWMSGAEHLPLHDRNVLKRALKAYRKRLKITLLDAESSLGGGPFSSGRHSSIVGITPPERYPSEVWEELVRQKRLIGSGQGTYELPPE